MAGSADYGRHWTRIGAPPAGPPNGAAGVSQIRFGDTMNGWAFGPSLYATHDGGTSWHLVNMPGRVIDLSVVTAQVFAVVATCSGSGSAYTAGCTQFTLYQAPARSNRWQRVAGVPAVSRFTPGGLQLTSAGGYLLAGRQLFSGPLTGGPWHRVGSGSATVPQCLRTPGVVPGPAFIAQAQLVLYLACDAGQAHGSLGPARLTLYSSPDGGLTWQRAGPIPAPGAPTSLAAIPAGAIVLATTKGIEYSADGTHWQSASLAGSQPRGGFSYVGMTTTTNGVAVPARSASGVLFVTTDGGATWVRSRISR